MYHELQLDKNSSYITAIAKLYIGVKIGVVALSFKL